MGTKNPSFISASPLRQLPLSQPAQPVLEALISHFLRSWAFQCPLGALGALRVRDSRASEGLNQGVKWTCLHSSNLAGRVPVGFPFTDLENRKVNKPLVFNNNFFLILREGRERKHLLGKGCRGQTSFYETDRQREESLRMAQCSGRTESAAQEASIAQGR